MIQRLALLLSLCGVASAWADEAEVAREPATETTRDGEKRDPGEEKFENVKSVVTALVKHGPLELSTADTSAAERFHLVAQFMATDATDKGVINFNLTVVRDGKHVAMTLRPGEDSNSPPYMYATDGLVVVVDRSRPGGLLVFEPRMGPNFNYSADERGTRFEWSCAPVDKPGRILFDAAPILNGALSSAFDARYDPKIGGVTLWTASGKYFAVVPRPGHPRSPIGLNLLAFSNVKPSTGRGVAIVTTIGFTPRPEIDYFQVTREAVQKLGVPTRAPAKEDGNPLDPTRLVFPRSGFAADDPVREAAEKLGTLLPPFEEPKEKSEFRL